MMRLERIRKSKVAKVAALVLAFETATQTFAPISAFALTTGPSQPEMLSFEPVGTSEMVNVFSGDFTYNIPLLDVGGYPINLSYNSGITTDQEASWVGLGWNINPGAINRSMRGLPDDFSGDQVTKRFNMKPNRTYSAGAKVGGEAFGFGAGNLSYGVTLSYNNYTGVGYQQTLNMTFTSGEGAKGELSGGLGVTSGTGGLDLTATVSYGHKIKNKEKQDVKGEGSLGLSMNSRSGLRQLSLSASVSEKSTWVEKLKDENGNETGKERTHESSRATNGGSSISFASSTYTPQVNMPMVNTSLAVSFKPGADFFGGDVTLNLNGSYSEQRLERTSQGLPAYGYLNSQRGMNDAYAMHDFNREKDGAFTENTPSLPLTNYSYDVYSVNGQGIGGMYRPFRSDLGYVYDARNGTTSLSGNLGVELSSGNIVHGGVDVSITDVTTTSGRWTSDDNATPDLPFLYNNDSRIASAAYRPLFEPYYFKEAGEKSVDSDGQLYTDLGGAEPIRIELDHTTGLNVEATDNFRLNNGSVITGPSLNYRSARQRRNQSISLLTVAEAKKYGLQKSFYSSDISSQAKAHHIGEITALRSDGSRYVFGIPAYNNLQQDATFNVQGRTTCIAKGLVTYSSGDNSIQNGLGIDNYFNETELPAYAHSFLLTAVLSPDYVDYDNIEGPSPGDLGSYTRINYTRSVPVFKWRTPLNSTAYSANYNEGLKSESSDDKGSYVYGEKEIWYVSSIETKTYVAVFSLSNRDDGLGVTDKDGTVDANVRLKKLDKISLYSKPDYDANPSTAVPIKVAHFTYDYSLCAGIPNSSNGGGKLTLTKLYFSYGNSNKAKLSDYRFRYADMDHNGTQDMNFNYGQKASDRWGNFLPLPTGTDGFTSCSSTYTAATTKLGPWEYPYSEQDRAIVSAGATKSSLFSAAWSLTDIDLPSGGTISVDYEADDYAFVQDKRAAQMFKVTDFKIDETDPSQPSTAVNTIITTKNLSVPVSAPQNYGGTTFYLYFKLQTNLATSTTAAVLANDYLGNQKTNIYFRFLTDITNSGDYEYVSGYFDIEPGSDGGIGLVTDAPNLSGGLSQYGWIRLKRVPIGDRDNAYTADVNPLCKAAWQYGRLNLARKVWGEPDPQGNGVEQVITAMAGSNMAQNIIDFFKGPNRVIRDKAYGRTAVMNKSWIRLNNPDGKKYGGGSRVKRIGIKNNWKYMVTTNNAGTTTTNPALPTNYDAMYGQEYTYTTTDPANSSRTISSGVASYEPSLGGDENPFREPVYFHEEKRLVPDDESFIEKPYGESFFPSPGVGYSKVTVKSLANSAENGNGQVTRHNTGYTVQEFYTAYDFPTITRVGWLDVQHWRTNPILSLLRIDMKDYLTATQGFVVETNDMHGKPKAVTVYEQGKTTPLSQVKYFYKTNGANAKQLDNQVLAIGKDGHATMQTCGLDYDFVADMREQETKMVSAGANMNVAAFLAAIIPAVVPTIIPSWSSEHTRFRSAGTTKVINRYGILERTEATDAGGTATTENLAWDKETGEVLLTKTYTDYDDAVYNFAYPAHWAYDRMGQAYRNISASFTGTISSGTITLTGTMDPRPYFVPGDEVAIEVGSSYARGWVCSTSSTTVSAIDIAGGTSLLPSGSCSVKIIRSGRRNMQAVSVGTIVTRTNPLIDPNADQVYDLFFENVLNAGSVEFAEQWSVAPGSSENTGCLCTLTDLGGQFATLLSTLANAGKLTVNTTLLSSGVYSYGYNAALNAPRHTPAPTSMNWLATGTGTNVMQGVLNGGGDVTDCITTLTLPSGYTWTQVVSLSNIQASSSDCEATTSTFSGYATLNTGDGYAVVPFTGTTECYDMGDCSSSTPCGVQTEQVVNPYFQDILGNWRMLKNYLYLSDRKQYTFTGPNSDNMDTRRDGVFETRDQSTGSVIDFQPFWSPNSGNDWIKSSTYWTWSQEVTKYTPFGSEVEAKDALGRYSSAIFGYNNTLPLAVASNSLQQDIGYDGFEDYAFITQDCRQLHFSFYNATPDNTQAHTGLYSMKVAASSTVSMARTLATTLNSHPSPSCPYTITDGDLNGVFAPYTGGGAKTFLINYWVKESTTLGTPVFNYSNARAEVYVNASPVTLTLVQKSGIIEGWQQVQFSFTLSASQSGTIEVKLKNYGSTDAWFDDVRVMPFDASMTTYVYHPVNQRLTSQLDENNYATFYEYDEEGALIRVKKETERGIVTLKEARNNSFHR